MIKFDDLVAGIDKRHNVIDLGLSFKALKELRDWAVALQDALEDKSPELDYPDQPMHTDHQGEIRFRSNRIVRVLLERTRAHGFTLNEIMDMAGCGAFSRDELRQLAQLLGYTLGGYLELDFVDDASKDRAERAAARLIEDSGPAVLCEACGAKFTPTGHWALRDHRIAQHGDPSCRR